MQNDWILFHKVPADEYKILVEGVRFHVCIFLCGGVPWDFSNQKHVTWQKKKKKHPARDSELG